MVKSTWAIDPVHSEVGFKVKHLMITNIIGNLNAFQATIETDNDQFETSDISFSANVSSINTNNMDRDNHLKSADFFDVEHFPTISFKSTRINKINENQLEVIGELTLKGVAKSVTLKVKFNGLMNDLWGNTKAGFSLSGKINRTDFGLAWNTSLETGGVLVGEEIKLGAEIQLVKK